MVYLLKRILLAFILLTVFSPVLYAGEIIRLRSTADIWLSSANPGERNSSSGKHKRLKLKTIQEMSAIRFDADPVRGREVLNARLHLRRIGDDRLRYIRVSTVNQDWVEGDSENAYSPPEGATYLYADYDSRHPWAWPGSCFADVIMTSGNSLATWDECRKLDDGWISVELTPELVYALAVDDTDGLAIMDGGDLTYHNNYIHSVQSKGSEPYIEVEVGQPLEAVPEKPVIEAEPALERAHIDSGAIRISIRNTPHVFCWRLRLNGRPVERWRVKHPQPGEFTEFYLEELAPDQEYDLEVMAVSPGGQVSPSAKMTISASPALSRNLELEKLKKPVAEASEQFQNDKTRVWALPGLVKVSPKNSEVMFGDMEDGNHTANAVWDGEKIKLFGARGEYVSYQLCIENLTQASLDASIHFRGMNGQVEIEPFRNWYAKNRDENLQPAYCIPLENGQILEIPASENRGFYVDIYILKDARPGDHYGKVIVKTDAREVALPVKLTVFDFALPDKLSFWPELNAYHIPRSAHAYYQLAHQHRCVLNCWRWTPKTRGAGQDIEVVWDEYDRNVAPLLSGEAFRNNRRSGVPVDCMYLPFYDSWPTPLTKDNYNYQGHWPGRGGDRKYINEHYQRALYIGDALSQEYKDAFWSVQRQFIEHFRQKGWDQTEMQCFYGGKNTHRIKYGSNMWWTTDEPYHWDDWLALQFFCRMWTEGRGNADPERWPARADISRPQWQGRVLDGIVDTVYFGAGAFSSPDMYRRCRILSQDTGLKIMTYGSANPDNESNTRSVVWILNAWLNGANGVLPWQTLGGDNALDANDRGAGGGNALLVPGKRFGLDVVGDMRLKALRDGQQLVEYLVILAERYDLRREQIKDMIYRSIKFEAGTRSGTGADNADSLEFSTLKAWQISELRRRIAELIMTGGNDGY